MKWLDLDLLYRSAPVGMCQIGSDHNILKANKAMAMMVGALLEDDLCGQSIGEVHPDLSNQLLPVCHHIYESGTPMQSYVICLAGEHKRQGPRYWLTSSYPLYMADGTIGATSHFFQDISELRQAQEDIRLSKVMLQSVFDGISDPLVMIDRDLKVRMFNQAAKNYHRIADYSDLLGKKYDGLHKGGQDNTGQNISRAISSGNPVIFERQGYKDPEKTEKVTLYPLSHSASGLEGGIVQITDITKTKAIERRIIQNEKLASLGLLVSGVAHEINNPNNFITFNVPILKSYMKAMVQQVSEETRNNESKDWFGMSFDEFSNEIFKLIGNLERGTHRIADIVENLRMLVQAESGGKSRQPCDIAKIVRHVEALCRKEIRTFVKTFVVHCPDDLPMVLSDAAALEQILINLLINAAHAANKPQSKIKLSVALENQVLKIAVEDNGAGMDDETLKKIFDPFFTTKDPGIGTGLGLSVCHSLVNAMNGTLEVKSVVNTGTVFSVKLPIRFADQSELPEHSAAAILKRDLEKSCDQSNALTDVSVQYQGEPQPN